MNERIKEIRKSLDLSQTKFGESIGISGPAVAKIESGINNPSESTLKLICATYNVNYAWLTTGQGDMFLPLDTDALVDKVLADEPEWVKSIMKAFCKLPDEEWVKFAALVERIKKEGV